MNIYRMANGLTLILLLICTLLMFVIYIEWQGLDDINTTLDIDNGNKQDLKQDSEILNNISQSNIAISQFVEILNRPLFVQGRMPFEEEQQEKNNTTILSQLKLTLEGIVISPESRVAVVRDITNNSIVRLEVGMIHNGWRLKNVQKQSADFERGDETQTIQIELANTQADKDKTPALKLPINRKGQSKQPRR